MAQSSRRVRPLLPKVPRDGMETQVQALESRKRSLESQEASSGKSRRHKAPRKEASAWDAIRGRVEYLYPRQGLDEIKEG